MRLSRVGRTIALVAGILLSTSLLAQKEFKGKRKKFHQLPKALLEQSDWSHIDLRKNKLEVFPLVLGEHERLKELRLSRNPLVWQDTLIGFPALEYLDLWDTDIETVPVYVAGFSSLKKLDLRETYLDEENREALEAVFPGVQILLSERCDCRPKK